MLDIRRLWDFNDPTGSEMRLRQALQSATGTQADVLRTQIARALGLQDRFDEADSMLRDRPRVEIQENSCGDVRQRQLRASAVGQYEFARFYVC